MDRRTYERVKAEAKGTFIIRQGGKYIAEFVAGIEDISEAGIKVIVNAEEYDHVQELIGAGSQLSFQAVDNYNLYGNDVTKIFNGTVSVVRKELNGQSLLLGCKIRPLTRELQEYIEERKVSVFIERMHGFN